MIAQIKSVVLYLTLTAVLALPACLGTGDINIDDATGLTTVEIPPDKIPPDVIPPGGGGDGGGGPTDPPTPPMLADLFKLNGGQWARLARFGVVDPVGTFLSEDFDGDGINNSDETTTNIWVADYPVIETRVATPVTMKILIDSSSQTNEDEIKSDITASDLETRKNEGSEKFHQNELALRTVQYETEVSQSASSSSSNSNAASSSNSASSSTSSNSSTTAASASGIGIGPISLGASAEATSTQNYSQTALSENEYSSQHTNNSASESAQSMRTQVFEDRPFRNNIDRSNTSVKADTAATQARKYRQDVKRTVGNSTVIKSNAGVVRAPFYIYNHSVNMPVKLSKIQASLLFETQQGELRPIKSFELVNDDYSDFEIEVYGGSEFGPYVIEVDNLNTAEVEKAISFGWTPKIFIIDYKMEHVADSNYARALSNIEGDNVKNVESNARGRTSLIKIMAPDTRQMYRVSAFSSKQVDLQNPPTVLRYEPTNPCSKAQIDQITDVSPGVPLWVALQRLKCTGVDIEFAHYIYDYSGIDLEPIRPKVYHFGIKSINGISANIPCAETLEAGSVIESDPNLAAYPNIPLKQASATDPICVVKIDELTEDELYSMSLWTVFDNGKFFSYNEFLRKEDVGTVPVGEDPKEVMTVNGNSHNDCPGSSCGISMMKGLAAPIWAGDNYDIVLLSVADFIKHEKDHGTNPLETEDEFFMTSRWDRGYLGEFPHYPGANSKFLGEAALGDIVEFKIKLEDTFFLDTVFGAALPAPGLPMGSQVNSFAYTRTQSNALFNLEQAFDFEINLGNGGTAEHWHNITRSASIYSANNVAPETTCSAGDPTCFVDCGRNWDFLEQSFTVCLKLPEVADGLLPGKPARLYLRQVPNNIYRNTIWPTPIDEVKSFDSVVKKVESVNELIIQYSIGDLSTVAPLCDNGTAYTTGTPLNIGDNNELPLPEQTQSSTLEGPYNFCIIDDETLGDYEYSIELETALTHTEAYLPKTRAYINAPALSGPVAELFMSNDLGYTNTSLLNSPPSTIPANCPKYFTANYNPFDCIGSTFTDTESSLFAANWLGSLSFANDWTDGSYFRDLPMVLSPAYEDAFFGTIRAYDYGAQIESTGSIARTTPDPSYLQPRIVKLSNEHYLLVWLDSGNTIKAQLYSTSGSGLVGTAITVGTETNSVTSLEAFVTDDNLSILWREDGGTISAQYLSYASDTENISLINSSVSLMSGTDNFLAKQVNEYILVTATVNTNADLDAAIINLEQTTNTGAFTIDSAASGTLDAPIVTISEVYNKAFVVWKEENGSSDEVRGAFFDVRSSNPTISITVITAGNLHNQPLLIGNETTAFVAWGVTGIYDGFGNFYSMLDETREGPQDQFLSPTLSNTELLGLSGNGKTALFQYQAGADNTINYVLIDLENYSTSAIPAQVLTSDGGEAVHVDFNGTYYAVYSSDQSDVESDIFLVIHNTDGGSHTALPAVQVNQNDEGSQHSVSAYFVKNILYIHWIDYEESPPVRRMRAYDARAREFISGEIDLGEVDVAVTGAFALLADPENERSVTVFSDNNQDLAIREDKLFPDFSLTNNTYGLNNFFVAPLLERRYNVSVRIRGDIQTIQEQ